MSDESKYSIEDLQRITDDLENSLSKTTHLLNQVQTRSTTDIRDLTLCYCLSRTQNVAKAALLSLKDRLPTPLSILARSMLEQMVVARWISLEDKNAVKFAEIPKTEMIRNMRKVLKGGFAKIKSRASGDDKTEEVLAHEMMNSVPGRERMEDLAKEGGLEKVYVQLYGQLSLYAHGFSYGLDRHYEEATLLYVMASGIVGTLDSILLICSDWMNKRQISSLEAIYGSLGYV